jgi:tRNA(Ile)-lysidine synthase TilS/MesJ
VGFKSVGGFRDAVLEDVLKFFSERAGVQVVNAVKNKKYNKLAVSDTIDMNADRIVHVVFDGDLSKIKKVNPVEGTTIKPLYLFLDEEVLLYAKIRGLKFKVVKSKKNDKIIEFVDSLNKKHPELRRAVVSGWLGMNGLSN